MKVQTQLRPVVLNQGQFDPPGDIWPCLETSLIITTRRVPTGMRRVEARNAEKYAVTHIMHRTTPPPTKDDQTPNASL